ncbi:A disintegrin and metalloproteinase with thrombospondin motif 9 [Desmophyllum pertusum]|uniref:A disintegrin and metalloproteinase with thrombospondin motif 9 n=1 Tax=Desmophyllum pertusum TaxID=174260 RepID=A0A9W9YIF2_9CNID|nr:A disintegrin and metalloproteinase with thrombospondin motif 9 [Desmophyllum pertusum]
MKKLPSAVLIVVLIHHVCVATEKKPAKGRARYPSNSNSSSNNGRIEYEVTIVERVNRIGKRHSPHKHFIKYDEDRVRTGTVYYRLAAFGRTFQFTLERDDSFLSPRLTVEHVYTDSRRLPFAGNLQHCFYRGEIQGDPNSTAVFNLCNGLRGSFVSNGERYFVEPANDRKVNSSAHFRKYHLVFRHSAAVGEGVSNAPSTCGVMETNKPLPLSRGLPPRPTNESNTRRRRRRNVHDSFVETLVVADKTMVDAFDSKADLESYIITLMGVVAQVYRDRSIGNSINIVVVKIVFLETNEPGIHISTDATRTLKSFCRWQKRVMMKEQSHPEHHDTAILLTKRNICLSPGKCNTLGLAELGTMCHPSRSCALAEDSGLSTAYTIAHELGHVFNVPHDGDNNRCTRSRGDQHLMARSLSFDTNPWSWSNCSRDKISQFLDLGYGACLSDKPHEKTQVKYNEALPGQVYSVDKQCQMIFGASSSLCPFMEPCRRLWCVKMIGRNRGCSTYHMPWADGTPCAKRKWCIRGQCVKRRRLKSVDGNWGQWGPYNECTRKCGGGITFSYRKCNNPIPENGGKYCVGQRKQFKSCNSEDCPKGSVDFRALQCVNTHARTVSTGSKSYRVTQWLPKYAGVRKENQCKLYCRMAGTAIYFKLRDKVVDGTPCNQETTDICVDGRCLPAGCDRVLNSKKKVDKCGVCDGDNSSCRRFTGTFNETKFALQIDKGDFLLNGGMVIGIGVREFRAAGSKFWYSGSDKATEQIKIDGKVTQKIKVHVLEVDDLKKGKVLPPNIHYALNQKVAEPTKVVYKWDQLGPWTQCSQLCQGQRKRRPKCVRAIDGQQVSNSRCDQRTRPSSVTEDCNISCRLEWQIQNPRKCSARCGTGYQSRTVRCMRVSSGRWDVVLDKHCPVSVKPPAVVNCEGTCEGSKWVYTEWTECSKSCDKGKQTRQAECMDDFGEILKERDCRPSDKQALRRPCNTLKCPWWTMGKWSSCSVTCGSGQYTRHVTCTGDQGIVPDTDCDPEKKPPITTSCDLKTCPYWFAGEWTRCSKSCDAGSKTRQVLCLSGGQVARAVKDEQCSAHTRPLSRKECKIKDCQTVLLNFDLRNTLEYYWRYTLWFPCSVTCGEKPGTRYRDVVCVKVKPGRQEVVEEQEVVEDNYCESTARPADTQECKVRPCTSWRHGSWGVCSQRCGWGYQLRVVKCAYANWKITTDENCAPKSRPKNRRDCQITPCKTTTTAINSEQTTYTIRTRPRTTPAPTTPREKPRWREGSWSECSVTCGQGVRHRQIDCRLNNGQISSKCDDDTRPTGAMDCILRTCPVWHEEPWSECSVSCGKGTRQRSVDCRFANGQSSPGCDEKNKPVTKQACDIRACPSWMAGDWGKCSVTCGSGVKARSVECSDKDISCDPTTKPQTTERCELETCPQWITSPWEECSVSCGEGQRQRSVDCRLANGQSSPGCDEILKPGSKEACNIRPCPTWMAGEWGQCSVTCGSGVKTRSVECSDKDISCDARTKPSTTERCGLQECPQWITSPWRECSVSCGEGTRQRRVDCKSANGRSSPGCDEKIRPVTEEACNIRSCPKWMTGDWGKCSVTCGSGVKIRSVECSDKDISCDARTKPPTTERCELKECPQWITSLWGECSVSCGKGTRQRIVDCRFANGQSSPGCDEKIKPETKEACDIRPCPTWMPGGWGKCSVTCGSGVKARSVECSDKDISCDARTKPQTTERCELQTCPQWTTSPWGKCSKSCSNGFKRRTVRCSGGIARCDRRSRPQSIARCNLGLCPEWKSGSWSPCSVTCGDGFKKRAVKCVGLSSLCNPNSKPQTTLRCNSGACPKWKTGQWSECSKSCGKGRKVRSVDCISSSNAQCDPKIKPDTTAECNHGTCSEWKVGEWQQCSVTCGRGWRRRKVECVGGNFRCDYRNQPDKYTMCDMGACPVWQAGKWSLCSVSCGDGKRERTVECSGGRGKCHPRTKPQATTSCNLGSCPEWKVKDWSQCSVSCGNGTKERTVECSGGRGRCDAKTEPQATTNCNLGSCPKWKAKDWSQCSVSCGNGKKERTVECSGGKDKCDARTKPQATTSCNLGSCPEWKVGDWSQCSVSCGNGTKERTVECSGGKGKCDTRTKPHARTSCNLGSCPEWKVGDWSQCSMSCGNGKRERTVECSGGKGKCDARTKPQATTNCNLVSCPEWKVGDWSQCSVTCGDGSKERNIECSRKDVSCDANIKPHATSRCNLGSCPVWQVGQWYQCSATCGNGSKRRAVICSGGRNKCDSKTKPEAISQCNPGSCPEWKVGEWNECSVTCGSGSKQRTVECSRSDVTCPTKMPTTTARCDLGACPKWETGEWSRCSVTCGDGRQQRPVTCSTGTNNCDPSTRPESSISCNAKSCPQWRVAKWSQCSATCDEGIKERLVKCEGGASACDAGNKPDDRASCNLGQCPHWKIGKWAECSVTCGSGYKRRQVECVSGVNATCDVRTKSTVKARCNLGLCPRWNTGRWTPCSRTCGEGIKRRAVGCFSMELRRLLHQSACDANLRPLGQDVCKIKECVPDASWHKGAWGKCSVYCGIGDKLRDVWCSAKNGTKISDIYCVDVHKPRTQRSCNKRRRCGEWEGGLWSECSKTCGEGTKSRAIRCLHQLEYKGEMFCDSKSQPAKKQPCNKGACPPALNLYHWQTSTWSQCSSSCGYGQKSRDVWCVDLSRRKVSSERCSPSSKPENVSACFESKCPPKWKHGDWSACSKTCGRGYQYRSVECVAKLGGTQSSNTKCDRRAKPPVWRTCNLGQCGGVLFWRVGPWSQCSVSCGSGVMKRAVKCFARNGTFLDDSYCTSPISSKPDHTRLCHMKACPPTSCKDIQSTIGVQTDGEQALFVQGKELQVYCHAMMSEKPKEYITLKTGPSDNFAEIYPKRLRNPRGCPANGSHFDECDCEDEDYKLSGGSYFSKLRIDLSTMKIIQEDKQFASTRGLNPPSYGTAGDCYSAQGKCPQGRFSINLQDTGIKLTSKVMWGSTGQGYSQIIYRYPEGLKVIGKCGGRCGICSPEADVGLKVEMVEEDVS